MGKSPCSDCKFETNEEDELKLHHIRKHTDKENLKFPNNCHICEFELENSRDFRLHMDIHSVKRTLLGDFVCADCNFLSNKIETMEVHFGKCCVKDLFCGLCDWKSDKLENLDIHLKSCEVYECQECDRRYLSLKEVKMHINEEHGKDASFLHLKMNRSFENFVDVKKYAYSEV